mmetsp:Transcript_47793/g.55877  ORF Transcript_47793/g.55877 Transcript_47793/m.55877 type:complete len:697 (+) Transcript_47793:181-2271(+)|eukprot:CAMPEP_0194363162 /NCGR_PEP_ID=MMETSP0174-20130528/11052_1 /TAXON_ID=216777 /ORGANISM="Proboscia alata, Strain PI-D3" /LENGTH=696 /DNA_ID=CAMNT_0039136507 /DNA_START=158 /DNA_END=2248 /DNA_ORIENTATION=-
MAEEDKDAGNVQVVVRVRPMVSIESGSEPCINVKPPLDEYGDEILGEEDTDVISNTLEIKGHDFIFDKILQQKTAQSTCYDMCAKPLVQSCLKGYNATVLAYGQTGSGKTHTILGEIGDEAGIIPRAVSDMFEQLNNMKRDNEQETFDYEVHVQFLEVYGEDLRDLLQDPKSLGKTEKPPKLLIRDGRGSKAEPQVIGALEQRIHSADEGMKLVYEGLKRRVTGATKMNAESSRSHAIFTLVVQQVSSSTVPIDEETPEKMNRARSRRRKAVTVEVKKSKFNFVDLAGAERAKRTQASGNRLKEGININKGLLVLGNVISALSDGTKRGSFVPYRDSKLTRLLRGSIGGSHKTLMVACVSPSLNNIEESLNCLRYANRAKNIQNNAVMNVDANTTKIVEELKTQVKTMSKEILTVKSHVKAMANELLRIQSLANNGESVMLKSVFSVDELKSFAGQAGIGDLPLQIKMDTGRISSMQESAKENVSNMCLPSEVHGRSDNEEHSVSSCSTRVVTPIFERDHTEQTAGMITQKTVKKEAEFMTKIYEFERKVAMLRMSLGREAPKEENKIEEVEVGLCLEKMTINNTDDDPSKPDVPVVLDRIALSDSPLFCIKKANEVDESLFESSQELNLPLEPNKKIENASVDFVCNDSSCLSQIDLSQVSSVVKRQATISWNIKMFFKKQKVNHSASESEQKSE